MMSEIKKVSETFNTILNEVRNYIIGRDKAIERLFEALLVGGHVLIEGVPGTAKTYVAKAFASALSLDFKRVQLTPDLLPSDIIGVLVYTQKEARFSFRKGPIFTNILLADELNRTPPKTQSALLEGMQEGQVTIAGETYKLPQPFMVIATENPVESEGVYPLPEAVLDRFLFRVITPYPETEEEVEVLKKKLKYGEALDIEPVINALELGKMIKAISNVKVSNSIMEYIIKLVRATRENSSVLLGASTRAAVHVFYASRAHAAVSEGRDYVIPDDVINVFPDTINHRLILRPEVIIGSYSKEPLWTFRTLMSVVRGVIESVPIPR